jgi:DnaJ-class molecular chaperone
MDIHASLNVDIWTALVGGRIAVPTVEGSVMCDIPPGLASGSTVKLCGKGWSDEDGNRGDHVVTVQLQLPATRPTSLIRSLVQWLQLLWPAGHDKPMPLPAQPEEDSEQGRTAH